MDTVNFNLFIPLIFIKFHLTQFPFIKHSHVYKYANKETEMNLVYLKSFCY